MGGACSCPSPRPLALRRISNDFFASVAPSMASDGARTALVWSQPEYQSHSTWSVWLQLLDRDGAPIGSPVVLASGTALFAASVAWTGSEWAVVWLARQATSPYPNHPIFLRVASDGTPIGTPVDLATSFSPTGLDAISVAIGHAPGSGLAMLVGTASDVRLLLLGSGEGPFGTPTRVGESGAYRVSLVGAPDGRFGALLGSDELQVVNADGSITTSVVPFSTLSDPQLAHDGSTWLVTGVRYEHGGDRLVALRGPSLTSTTTLTTVARYVRQSAIAIAGDGSATVVWSDAISYHGAERLGRLHSVRLRLPASATEAAVVETASSALFPEAMVDYDERHAVVHVGADRFVSAWVDRRWGQAEIYALAAEIPACM